MKTIKPPALKAGQNLGIIALSTPAKSLKPEFRKRAYQRIHDLFGLNVIEAPNLDLELGHAAGSIKERVDSLHNFFKRKDIHGIMSFWGGMNTHQILEYLNYDLIKKNPKVLIGYSDTTTLLSAITAKTGLVTFNGPSYHDEIVHDNLDCNRWTIVVHDWLSVPGLVYPTQVRIKKVSDEAIDLNVTMEHWSGWSDFFVRCGVMVLK